MGHSSDQSGEFLGEIRLGRSLTTTGQVIARGLAILVGGLFLLPSQGLPLVGPWFPLAVVLASAALGLTLLSVLELMGGSGEHGGTYVLIQETWGGLGAFLAGWAILAGSAALAAALAQAAAEHLVLVYPGPSPPTACIAPALLGLLSAAELAQVLPCLDLRRRLTALVMAPVAVALISALPRMGRRWLQMAPPLGLMELIRITGGLAAGYVVFEALLLSRRQVRDPGRLLPTATWKALLFSTLALVAVGLITSGLGPPGRLEGTGLAEALAEASFLPRWALGLVAFLALAVAADGCLMVAVRQMHALSREGGLPSSLRRPLGPFAALVAATAPLALWVPGRWLTDVAAAMSLVTMTLLNIAAIHSRRAEPERRRPLRVPFHPLAPGMAIALNLALLWSLSPSSLLGGGVGLAAGTLIYLSYARGRQVAAQEGVVVFGRERRERAEGIYRILVPIGPEDERHLMLRLAVALAHQLKGEVIPLQVIPTRDPLAIEEGRRVAWERNTLFRWSLRMGTDAQVPMMPLTRLARSVPQGILDSAVEEDCDLILMTWPGRTTSTGARMGHILDPVIRKAPCDVMIVAYRPKEDETRSEVSIDRILVPTAGGPHAPLATRLALLIAREYGATVTAVWVAEVGASAEEIAEGRRRIQQTIAAMRQQAAALSGGAADLEEIPIESRVIAAESVVDGIVEAGAESNLVLIGASEESLIDQVLFGTLPEQVARECPTPVLMVKRYRGLPHFWLQRIWDALVEALPQLSMEEQIEVYRAVRLDARPDVDFFMMMGLSAIIATLGLLQGSAAVIIGAMLVAPLFTPILTLSLAIVRGDVRLLLTAVESALKGIALAIGAAIALTAVSPLRDVTPEIAARIRPNLFDLAVALVSGAAGVYAIARKDVAAALPGVAIAAALMPPLCTAGIGLAMGNLAIMGGGGLLFITNLIAIALAGSVMLLLLGFRPAHPHGRQARLRLGLMATVALLLLITIPLAAVFVQAVRASQAGERIRATLSRQVEALPEVELVQVTVRERGGEMEVTASVYAERMPPTALPSQWSEELSRAVGRPVHLRLAVIPVTSAYSERPSQP